VRFGGHHSLTLALAMTLALTPAPAPNPFTHGRLHAQAKKFERAIKRYGRALEPLESDHSFSSEEKDRAKVPNPNLSPNPNSFSSEEKDRTKVCGSSNPRLTSPRVEVEVGAKTPRRRRDPPPTADRTRDVAETEGVSCYR